MNIPAKTKKYFEDIVVDAPNWSGMPLFGGNTPERKGCLMTLKKLGLVITFTDEGCTWITFTEKGETLATKMFDFVDENYFS